ncbi:MAG: TRAP transporter TatT component family protein [Proteobacteria bacterium]|nr:TRAP transporter TatT component family protein [Pseudomonadota bacterium]
MDHQQRAPHFVIAFIFSLLTLFSSGCSTKLMLRGTANVVAPFIPVAVDDMMRGIDVSYNQGIYAPPGLIALAAGFSEVSPNNYTLAWSTSQVFVATAGYNEMYRPEYANELAWQGYRFGMRSLMTHKKFRKAIESGMPVEKAVNMLPKKYVEGLTWTGMSLALWMMMNIDDVMTITYAPEANSMIKRACELDGAYFHGLPWMLDAVFSAMASQMVQGCGFERAQASYAKMKAVSGGKLLIGDAFYAQIYAVAIRDRKLYEDLLQGILDAPDDILEGHGYYITTLAKGRAKYLLEHEVSIFENMGTIK